jgi:dihydrofolate synthase/folylpolyglutamate synthase
MFSDFLLDDWLSYLERSHAQEIQLGLDRVGAVARRLNLHTCHAPVITVTGTNGKGSTIAALEAIYVAAGYKVGAFTSPHLMVFNERIRLNQQMISDDELCAAFMAIESGREDTPLTYFETTTLAALWFFKDHPLDILLLEVGLGGRLDATNSIDADLAIITTVDLDHQDYLGDTIEKIGYEKAGIFRANKPVIYADINPPKSVLEQADRLKTPFYCLGQHYTVETTSDALIINSSTYLPKPSIHPNAAAAAYMASTCLQAVLPVTFEHLSQAMQKVCMMGRQQVIGNSIKTMFDVSHNPQAVSLLAEFVRGFMPKQRVHAVFSGLKDKDLCGLIKPMLSCVDVWYPALLKGPRAASESLMTSAFLEANSTMPPCYEDPATAYQVALKNAKEGDLIIVYGSFFTVRDVMGQEI